MEVLKILVIQTAFIGDAVLTLPMIQKLYSDNNKPVIDVVSIPGTEEIFNANPCVNRVFAFDKKCSEKSLSSVIKFALELRKEKYDRIYSPHRSFRTSVLVALSGAGSTCGFDNSSASFVYTNRIRYRNDVHEVIRNFDLIGASFDDDESWRIMPEIILPANLQKKVKDFVSSHSSGKGYAAVAPGSVWATKKFPKEKYIEIIRHLKDKGITVFITGGNADKMEADEMAAAIGNPNVISVAGLFTITETIEMYRYCSIVISNDSAPVHFSMCANAPALTLFCSTVPEFGFYPYSKSSRYLSYNDLKCKPCGIHGHNKCPEGTFACAEKLELPVIYRVIDEILSRNIK